MYLQERLDVLVNAFRRGSSKCQGWSPALRLLFYIYTGPAYFPADNTKNTARLRSGTLHQRGFSAAGSSVYLYLVSWQLCIILQKMPYLSGWWVLGAFWTASCHHTGLGARYKESSRRGLQQFPGFSSTISKIFSSSFVCNWWGVP